MYDAQMDEEQKGGRSEGICAMAVAPNAVMTDTNINLFGGRGHSSTPMASSNNRAFQRHASQTHPQPLNSNPHVNHQVRAARTPNSQKLTKPTSGKMSS